MAQGRIQNEPAIQQVRRNVEIKSIKHTRKFRKLHVVNVARNVRNCGRWWQIFLSVNRRFMKHKIFALNSSLFSFYSLSCFKCYHRIFSGAKYMLQLMWAEECLHFLSCKAFSQVQFFARIKSANKSETISLLTLAIISSSTEYRKEKFSK